VLERLSKETSSGSPLLQRVARRVSGLLGRDSAAIRVLRPFYERLLELWPNSSGFLRELNGVEHFYISPRHRGLFPGEYDRDVMAYLRAHVRRGSVSLNVGAHVGVYTLCLAEWSGPQGRVFAFEPNPFTRELLRDHVRRNQYQERVDVRPEAMGSETGTAILQCAPFSGTSRLESSNPATRHVTHSALMVPLTTVDSFCDERHLQPDWIVMDIEGYEVAALGAARRTIHRGRGRLGLVVEMHPALWKLSGTSRSKMEDTLTDLCLHPIGLGGQADPLAENGMVLLKHA
jgi:FkbM family methyltransferase